MIKRQNSYQLAPRNFSIIHLYRLFLKSAIPLFLFLPLSAVLELLQIQPFLFSNTSQMFTEVLTWNFGRLALSVTSCLLKLLQLQSVLSFFLNLTTATLFQQVFLNISYIDFNTYRIMLPALFVSPLNLNMSLLCFTLFTGLSSQTGQITKYLH